MSKRKGSSEEEEADTGTPTTMREVELKLRVHALFRLPELAGDVWRVAAVEVRPTLHMTAVYHDTEDLRLFRWGVTLRRRSGGPDEGWHMKLPVEGSGSSVRDELRVPLEAGEVGHVPHELSDIVTAFVREAPLGPVVELRTDRTPYLLLDAEGQELAELVDDTVSVVDGDAVVERFREIEIEARGHEPEDLELLAAVSGALVEHGAVPGTSSKAASALGPRAEAPPDVLEPGTVKPGDEAGDAVRQLLQTHVRRFLLQDVRVRRDLPDSVHQMRVAARRLRSGLRVFAPLVDAEWAGRLREELGWAASELGMVRDTEVLLRRLDEHSEQLPPEDAARVVAAIDPWMRDRLEVARADALVDLRSDRHRQLLVDLVDAARHPRLSELAEEPCKEVLPPLVRKAWRRLAKDVKGLRLDGPSEDWHAARIHAKRARYSAEAVVPVFGDPARKLAGAMERVTELLGEHQDAAVAQEVVRELASHEGIDGPTGFALGLLHALEVEEELVARVEFEEVWPKVRKTARSTRLA